MNSFQFGFRKKLLINASSTTSKSIKTESASRHHQFPHFKRKYYPAFPKAFVFTLTFQFLFPMLNSPVAQFNRFFLVQRMQNISLYLILKQLRSTHASPFSIIATTTSISSTGRSDSTDFINMDLHEKRKNHSKLSDD